MLRRKQGTLIYMTIILVLATYVPTFSTFQHVAIALPLCVHITIIQIATIVRVPCLLTFIAKINP